MGPVVADAFIKCQNNTIETFHEGQWQICLTIGLIQAFMTFSMLSFGRMGGR